MEQSPRHFTGGIQNERVRAGSEILQQPVLGVVHLRIDPDVRKVPAYQSKVMLVIQPANPLDPIRRLLVTQVTTNGIGGIRGVNNHPTTAKNVHRLIDQTLLRRLRMNLEKLTH